MRGRNNQEFHRILYEQLQFCSLLPRATNFGEVASAVRPNANRPSSFNLERVMRFFWQKVQDAEYNFCIICDFLLKVRHKYIDDASPYRIPPKQLIPKVERFYQVTGRQVKAWDYPWLVLELARGSLRWVPHEPTARTIICWRLLASQVGELQRVPADEMMVWLNPQSLTATSRKRDFSAKGVKGITWSWCIDSLLPVDGKKHHNK